ncbi:hypothetical protein Q5530_06670 [Saccharothrix sp. BKS2]|uniref:STAS domain-containing protein n=1 Tax=Saccharothrix sp. BKS2 TaxID=3064400 RepID=UPI0039EA63F7
MSTTTAVPDAGVRRCAVDLSGTATGEVVLRVTGGVPYPMVGELLEGFFRVLDTDAPAVVVDLTGVGLLCSEAAYALSALARWCDRSGRALRLVPSPVVRRKVAVLGLLDAVPLTPS